MDVTYLRYQDDILIFAQTKRQLERCKQKLMNVLRERRLSLSSKKTRIGHINKGFHFLGINYPETQLLDRTNVTQVPSSSAIESNSVHYLFSRGGGTTVFRLLTTRHLSKNVSFHMHERYVMHARMLNKWSLIEFLSTESRVIYIAGARGG